MQSSTDSLMFNLIRQCLQSFEKRKKDIQDIELLYNQRSKIFKEKKAQLLAKLNGIPVEIISQDLRDKLIENFDHLELRIKRDFMPRSEILRQLEQINQYLALFNHESYALTGVHLKKYQSLSRLYLDINVSNDGNIIERHRRSIESYDADFKELCDFKQIDQYVKLKKQHSEEVERTKKEILDELKKYAKQIN